MSSCRTICICFACRPCANLKMSAIGRPIGNPALPRAGRGLKSSLFGSGRRGTANFGAGNRTAPSGSPSATILSGPDWSFARTIGRFKENGTDWLGTSRKDRKPGGATSVLPENNHGQDGACPSGNRAGLIPRGSSRGRGGACARFRRGSTCAGGGRRG